MLYSYIKPRSKSVLSPELKLMMVFFGVAWVMLFGTYGFLLLKSYTYDKSLNHIAKQKVEINSSIYNMNTQIELISKMQNEATQVFTRNEIMKNSIKNLFDLIPNRITLSKAILDEKSLVLYGITPNKEVYEFMLHAPLRSIFSESYSSFYPLDNGWYSFVSTNYLESELE